MKTKKMFNSLFMATMFSIFIFSFNGCSQKEDNLVNSNLKATNANSSNSSKSVIKFKVTLFDRSGNGSKSYDSKDGRVDLGTLGTFNDNVSKILVSPEGGGLFEMKIRLYRKANYDGVTSDITELDGIPVNFILTGRIRYNLTHWFYWDANVSSVRITVTR